MACRLIALNKNPGVCPIGMPGALKRIMGKAILTIADDFQRVAGSVQLCASQVAGTKGTIYAMNMAFEGEKIEAAMLVNANNAFNNLNWEAALRKKYKQLMCALPSPSSLPIQKTQSPHLPPINRPFNQKREFYSLRGTPRNGYLCCRHSSPD